MTLSAEAYYAPAGIRINVIAPGLVGTPMTARAQGDPRLLKYIADKQPPLLPNTVNVATDNGLSNTWLGTYDLGRQVFVSLTARY